MKRREWIHGVVRMAVLLFLFAACILANAGSAAAETKQEDLFYNDGVTSMIVWISYDVDDVTIALVDPEGNIIDPLDENSECNTFVGDTSILIVIPDAMEGQWQLSYDKGSNSSLTVQVGEYEEPIWITEFALDGISEDELQVTFQADYEGDLTYSYIIYLTTDTQGGAGRELASGNGSANEEQQIRVDLSSVNSYDTYYLRLYVYYIKDELEYFDDAYTDAFSFTNPETVEAIEDVDVEIDLSTNAVTIDWSDYMPYNAEGAYVTIEADGVSVDSIYYDRDEATDTTVYIDDGVSEVTVTISVRYTDGRISEDLIETISASPIDSDDLFSLKLPDNGTINTVSVSYEYANADEQEVILTQNGVEETLLLSGSGTGHLTLEDGSNVIEYSYYTEEINVLWHGTVYLIVDRIAPSITLYEDYDGSQTENDSIMIAGETDTDATLTIAGEAVEVSDSGTFLHTVALADGANEIEILAQDDAGNITNYTILVTCGAGSAVTGAAGSDSGAWNAFSSWLPLIAAVGASILLIILLLITLFVKKKKRGFLLSLRMFTVYFAIISFVGAAVGLIVWILRHSYIRSADFVEYAYYYADEAYDYIILTDRCLWAGLACAVVFAVMLLLTILTNVLKKKTPEQEAKKQAKREAKEAEKAQAREKKKRQAEEEETARKRQTEEEEAAKKRQTEEEEAARKRQAEEEEAARKRQAEEEEAARKRQAEEEEAARKRQTGETGRVPENEPAKIKPRFCRNCGKQLTEGAIFCGNCGKKVE